MDHLERLIKAARELRELGATSVKVSVDVIEASFAPPVVAQAETVALTEDEIAAERRATLLHSAG